MDTLLRYRDVQRILGVTAKTVYKLRRDGLLVASVLGPQTVRFRAEEIARYVKSKEAPSPE